MRTLSVFFIIYSTLFSHAEEGVTNIRLSRTSGAVGEKFISRILSNNNQGATFAVQGLPPTVVHRPNGMFDSVSSQKLTDADAGTWNVTITATKGATTTTVQATITIGNTSVLGTHGRRYKVADAVTFSIPA